VEIGHQKVDDITEHFRRMFKKAAQRGRSKRRGEAYSFPYGEPLSAARTKLEVFFNILSVMPDEALAGTDQPHD
jgi:hypothetical protein